MPVRFIRQTRDGNHKKLCDYVRDGGFEVIETFQPLDVLIFNHLLNQAGWAEIKTEQRDAHIQTTQIRFMAVTRMPVAFVKTREEMLEFAKTMVGITEHQKNNLATFLEDATKKKYHPAVVERVLSWK